MQWTYRVLLYTPLKVRFSMWHWLPLFGEGSILCLAGTMSYLALQNIVFASFEKMEVKMHFKFRTSS